MCVRGETLESSPTGAGIGTTAPGLLASLSFLSLSAYVVRMAEKFCKPRNKPSNQHDIVSTGLTFGLIPRRTVVRSLSSTSLCLIFFTISTSCASATYRRFDGEELGSVAPSLWCVEICAVVELPACGGVPGGVVDSTKKWRCT